jgi:ubiquinone/menaquinone biosynthesis C-methylase UbiE
MSSESINILPAQQANQEWWTENPMTYDWEETLSCTSGSAEWFEEIDRRFLSSAYYAHSTEHGPFGRFLRKQYVDGKEVLEVGCGMGTHASLLAKSGAHLTAIDLTQKAVEMTSRRFRVFQLTGQVQKADAENLLFPDGSFDMVWSWGVIHHSNSFEACLSEITRSLRDGGRLLLMVYYRPSLVYYIHCGLLRGVLLGQLLRRSLQQIYVDSSDGFYARVFNKTELKTLLEPSFDGIRMSVIGLKAELFPIPRNRFKERLEALTPDWLASSILGRWGSMIVVEATKKSIKS